ncbi:MAG: hypothetical protein ACK412_04925 [Chloroherpetonaceae bacterium]
METKPGTPLPTSRDELKAIVQEALREALRELKSDLKPLVKEVVRELLQEPNEASAEDETTYLLSRARTRQELLEAVARIEKGEGISFSANEFDELCAKIERKELTLADKHRLKKATS